MKRFCRPRALVFALTAGHFVNSGPLAEAQVVQLPSTRSLSYSGSVWVPDGGTTSLGGTSSSRYGSRRSGWGPTSNSASASGVGGTSLAASVQIIDLAAIDEALLSSAVASTAKASGPDSTNTVDGLAKVNGVATLGDVKSPVSEGPSGGLKPQATYLEEKTSARVGADPGKWQRVLSGGSPRPMGDPTLLESDIRYYLQRGEAAEQAGSLMAARVYYKMARDLMTPELVERYQRIVAERKAAEEARLKAELEFARRRF